ncbi:hypothetical protein BMETH_748_4 [methanotrophic bacterial endosymbiont of Bathymodiolus sp.]|nr:hypothetical protein BMETH_748_4 [methanotrophic bacterial endosymbiont of Bathymodiolus sp.]
MCLPHALGVFLLSSIQTRVISGLPHARGGVSFVKQVCESSIVVFPTPVGGVSIQ